MTAARSRQAFEEAEGLARTTIHVGEIFASREPTVVHTLLGSCVSVCLLDPRERIGGMNHILLPGSPDIRRHDACTRYGVNAMELLINKIAGLGGERRRLRAKVFGGANILNGFETGGTPGQKNGEFVLAFLSEEKIPIVGQDMGGENARRIYLRTDTGEVLLRRVPRFRVEKVIEEESIYTRKVRSEIEKPGKVTLF